MMVPNELYSGHRAAFIWKSAMQAIHTRIFHTRMGEKPTATQNSAAIRYPNAKSEELWYRKKIHPK